MPASVKGVFPYRLAPSPRVSDVKTSAQTWGSPGHQPRLCPLQTTLLSSTFLLTQFTVMQYYHLHSASLSGEAKGLGKCSNCIPTQKGTVNNLISFTFKGRLIKKQARYARKYNRVSECATELRCRATSADKNGKYSVYSFIHELLCVTHRGTKHVCSFKSCVQVVNSIPQGHEREAQKEAKYSSKLSHLKIMIKHVQTQLNSLPRMSESRSISLVQPKSH